MAGAVQSEDLLPSVQMKIDAQDDLEFILNLPAGPADIACFYRLISRCCLTLGAASFVQEEEVCALEEIDRLREELIRSNRSLVHEALKADLYVFGCIYPITLDETLFSLIEQAGKDQGDLVFERYMDHLQKKDCYCAPSAGIPRCRGCVPCALCAGGRGPHHLSDRSLSALWL